MARRADGAEGGTITRDTLGLLARAGLATALSDGLFASALNRFVFHAPVARVWQGVAGTLLGRGVFEGGAPTVLVGLAMHVGVAFGWSLVLLTIVTRWPWLRDVLVSRFGAVKVAAVYGPCIWLVMSLVVIPLLLQRPPSFTARWVIQLIGHFPFVGLPMATALARGMRRST